MKKIVRFVLWITCLYLSLPGNVCLAQNAATKQETTVFQQSTLLELKNIGVMIGKGESQEKYLEAWKRIVSKSKNMDINAAINFAIDEAKQEINRNVNQHRSKVQKYEAIKRTISQEISANRSMLGRSVGGKIQPIQKKIYVIEKRNPEKFAVQKGNVIATRGELENYINNLDAALNSVGDDAQLANVDLQNILQKQQQYIQQLSDISKMFYDTAMAVIRHIGS